MNIYLPALYNKFIRSPDVTLIISSLGEKKRVYFGRPFKQFIMLENNNFITIGMHPQLILSLDDLKHSFYTQKHETQIPQSVTFDEFDHLLSSTNCIIEKEICYTFEALDNYLKINKHLMNSYININKTGFQISFDQILVKDIKIVTQKIYKLGQSIIDILENPKKIDLEINKLERYRENIDFNDPLIKLLLLGPNSKAVHYVNYKLMKRLNIISNLQLKELHHNEFSESFHKIQSTISKRLEWREIQRRKVANLQATGMNMFTDPDEFSKKLSTSMEIGDLFSFIISDSATCITFGLTGTKIHFLVSQVLNYTKFNPYCFKIFQIMKTLNILEEFNSKLDEILFRMAIDN